MWSVDRNRGKNAASIWETPRGRDKSPPYTTTAPPDLRFVQAGYKKEEAGPEPQSGPQDPKALAQVLPDYTEEQRPDDDPKKPTKSDQVTTSEPGSVTIKITATDVETVQRAAIKEFCRKYLHQPLNDSQVEQIRQKWEKSHELRDWPKNFDGKVGQDLTVLVSPGSGDENTGFGEQDADLELNSSPKGELDALDALPPDIKDILFGQGGAAQTLKPEDYPTLLRIASKLKGLSPQERAHYKETASAATTDPRELEKSVDRFIEAIDGGKRDAEDREQIKQGLGGDGLADLFKLYVKYRDARHQTRDDLGVQTAQFPDYRTILEAPLLAGLRSHGFGSIEAFEDLIGKYKASYARLTLAIGEDMLARYAHLLFEEEKRYLNPANAKSLANSLVDAGAKQTFAAARTKRAAASDIRPPPKSDYRPDQLEQKQGLENQANTLRQKAEAQYDSATDHHPLTHDPDFDHEKLANADPGQVQRILLDHIKEKREAVTKTLANLRGDHQLLYALDPLREASIKAQGIAEGSIYHLIIMDERQRIQRNEASLDFLLLVLIAAANLLIPAGGTVGVVGAVTVTIGDMGSVIRAREAYEVEHNAYEAGLLDDDPSFFWVALAIAGMVLDASVIARMKPALAAFNTGHDVAKLNAALEGLPEVSPSVRAEVVRAAKVEAEIKTILSGLPALDEALKRESDGVRKLVAAAEAQVKNGDPSFKNFLKRLEEQGLFKGELSKPQRRALQNIFEEGKKSASAKVGAGEIPPAFTHKREIPPYKLNGKVLKEGDVPESEIDKLGNAHLSAAPKRVLYRSELVAEWFIGKQTNTDFVVSGERNCAKLLAKDGEPPIGGRMVDLVQVDKKGIFVPIEVKNEREITIGKGKGNDALLKFENIAEQGDLNKIKHFEILCNKGSKLPPNFRVGDSGVLEKLISGEDRWEKVLIGGKEVKIRGAPFGKLRQAGEPRWSPRGTPTGP